MPEKLVSPALDGWHTIGEDPQLLGSQCVECLTYFFPKNERECKNPNCSSTKFVEIPLSREGELTMLFEHVDDFQLHPKQQIGNHQ